MKFWFCISLVFIVYPYLIYPILLVITKYARNQAVAVRDVDDQLTSSGEVQVSVIVPFHNESIALSEKITNTLDCCFPRSKIEFIFVSDGSNHASEDIVSNHNELILVRTGKRVGKDQALSVAVQMAQGNIVIFSDVGVIAPSDAISRLVYHFQDPECGVVSSCDQVEEGELSLEGAFVRMEMFIRRYEAMLSSPIGVSGSFFATRRELLQVQPRGQCWDLSIALTCFRKRLFIVIDDHIKCTYKKAKSSAIEFERKKRTIVNGMNVVIANLDLLNPVKYGWFSWQLLSHKILRWAAPLVFTISVLTLAWQLLQWFFSIVGFDLSSIVGVTCFLGLFLLVLTRIESFRFVIASSFAVFGAIFEVIRGNKYSQWVPTNRSV